jgi:hypothetical protein
MLPFFILALATNKTISSFVFGMLLVLLFLSGAVGAIITTVVLVVALLYWLCNR